MDIEIIGRHVEITPEIRQYTESRLQKLLKFFGRMHSLKAVFDVDGPNHQTEIIAHLVKGEVIVAKAPAQDVYSAIDAAAAKLESQLRKYKDKLSEHRVKTETHEAAETSSPEDTTDDEPL